MTDPDFPLVSIYIPTHNRKELLRRAIFSILNQSYQHTEIIVIDDGSEDGTDLLINQISREQKNIKYFRNSYSMGAPVSRNIAIKNANGTFITGLDDDDYFLPERISKFVSNYASEYSFLFSNYIYDYGKFNKISKGEGIYTQNDMLYGNVVGNQVFTKKDMLMHVGGFDEKLSACQDYDLWLRLMINYGSALKISDPTYVVNARDDRLRISFNENTFRGYFDFYSKYKYLLNKSQRRFRLLHVYLRQNKKITFKKFLILTDIRRIKQALRLFFDLRYKKIYNFFSYYKFILRNTIKKHKNIDL